MRLSFVVPLWIATGCVAGPGIGARSRSDAITNGAPTDSDLGVVAFLPRCTGTLISDKVVLTAAHCVASPPEYVRFGSTMEAEGPQRRVIDAQAHPDYDPAALDHDIAVLRLEESAPEGATPWPLPTRQLDAELAGATIRIVGFGMTSATDTEPLRKREGTSVIESVASREFRTTAAPSQTCMGDSGGPAFLTVDDVETIVGVTSSGDDMCADHARATRVDVHVESFLRPYLDASATQTAAPGEACFEDANCASGVCFAPDDAPRKRYCSDACDADAECGASMICTTTARCEYLRPSPGAFGTACTTNADCSDSLCTAAADESSICTRSCLPSSSECGDGFECLSVEASTAYFACVPIPGSTLRATCAAGAGKSRAPHTGWVLLLVLAFQRRRTAR